MLGYSSPYEAIRDIVDIRQIYVEPELHASLKAVLEEAGIVRGFEVEIYRKDQEKLWVSLNIRTTRDQHSRRSMGTCSN
jgi:PAS domain-containing protein